MTQRNTYTILILLLFYGTLYAAEHTFRPGGATLTQLIEQASPGDVIRVLGEVKEGTITIDKRLHLIGENGAVIDGEQAGSVVVIHSDSVTVEGFTIRGTKSSNLNDNAGILVENSRHVQVLNNRLEQCYFGIVLNGCTDALVQGNTIIGHLAEEDQQGNGIHLWKGARHTISDNNCTGHRDGIYFEFISNSEVRGNTVKSNLRYGLHFMFSNHDKYMHNIFEDNGAGVAVMYSKFIDMEHNRFIANRGASAYGLLLKEINDATISNNHFEDNTTGMLVDGCNRIEANNNSFRANGWALRLFSNATACSFASNSFTANTFDLSTNGALMLNKLNGNYWDRYAGYDLDRDGHGDVPFRPLGFFSLLVEKVPYAMVFSRSLFVSLLDRAERLLPTLTPEAMKDDHPLMRTPVDQMMR